MELETQRLFLVPLTANQLRLWTENIKALEEELNCNYCAEPMEGIFYDIVKNQLNITEKDMENYLFHSFWFIIRKTDRTVVGSAGFKDIPKNKEVEIGYGLGKNYEHNGYMTETVKAMCEWAMKQENIEHIIAETEIDNLLSHNVLKRCGFVKYKQDNTALWWKLNGEQNETIYG